MINSADIALCDLAQMGSFSFSIKNRTVTHGDGVFAGVSGTHQMEQYISKQMYRRLLRKTARFFSCRRFLCGKVFYLSFIFSYQKEWPCTGMLMNARLTIGDDLVKVYGMVTHASADLRENFLVIRDNHSTTKGQRVVFMTALDGSKQIALEKYEYETLSFLSRGYSTKHIASMFQLSEHTINDIRKALLEKFNASNTFQLIYHAYQEGFI